MIKTRFNLTSYWHHLTTAVPSSIPILCAFLPLGIGFGCIAQQIGIEWHLTLFMALIVYAGSAEFMIAIMMSQGAIGVDIIITAALCNLRHIFYGISLQEHYPESGIIRYYMIHALTDETYALLSGSKRPNHNYTVCISLLNHIYWVVSVACGLVFGYFMTVKMEGLEFVLTALFVVLTIEQVYRIKEWSPFIFASIACCISLSLLPKTQMLLGSISIVSVLLVLQYHYTPEHKEV